MIMSTVQTLVDFLRLQEIRFSDGFFGYEVLTAGILDEFRPIISPLFLNEQELKSRLVSGLEYSKDFKKVHFGSIPEPEKTRERIIGEWNKLQTKVDGSSLEEIIKVGIELAANVEKNNPDAYYGAAIVAYRHVTEVLGDFSKAVGFLVREALPVLQSNGGFLKIEELGRLVPRDQLMDTIYNLPIPLRKQVLDKKELTTEDISRMNGTLQEYDAKRGALHKKILAYAKANFRKDYLDVCVDIMRGDAFKVESYMTLDPTGKGSVIITVGLIDLQSYVGGEFSRYYGETPEHWKYSIKAAEESLQEAREGRNFRRKPDYKSRIQGERSEEDDNALLQKIAEAFPDYVVFTGDYVIKNVHGHVIYAKLIEISLDRIRQREPNPTVAVQRVKEYIASQLPEVRAF